MIFWWTESIRIMASEPQDSPLRHIVHYGFLAKWLYLLANLDTVS
jgi:hypothetical protein